ncbi:hypothetical protein SAMN03080601_01648 [Alkalitalea saponilacus]|uniref:Uncharacterized protein n=1 Tax=Alkalitalea saponilacus TaxID=889453 RepID=A0A1T5FPF6_9BACT|nr:hypothetical protein SAMN03080601_01648 [Alkalitalea saponilacus]
MLPTVIPPDLNERVKILTYRTIKISFNRNMNVIFKVIDY